LNSITIVIPAYNEEKRLGPTLSAVLSYLERGRWEFKEIVVVDDGSTDGTAALVESVSARNPSVRLLRNPGNRGKGYSVRQGVLHARGAWILFTDADLSTPIEELDKLLEACRREGAVVAVGSRALDRSLIAVRQPGFREAAGRVFNLCVRLLTGLPFLDTQCGFKLFEANAAREIFRRQRISGFGFDVELLFIARLLGYRCTEAPVRWSHSEGSTVSMLRASINMFLDLARIRWNQLAGRYA